MILSVALVLPVLQLQTRVASDDVIN